MHLFDVYFLHFYLQQSGLSKWLGNQLSVLDYLAPWVLNLVLCYIVAAATEVTSNTATCTLMMPILSNLVMYNVYNVTVFRRCALKQVYKFKTSDKYCDMPKTQNTEQTILAHRIKISEILHWDKTSYLTHAILPRLSREGYLHCMYWNSHTWSSSDVIVVLK